MTMKKVLLDLGNDLKFTKRFKNKLSNLKNLIINNLTKN